LLWLAWLHQILSLVRVLTKSIKEEGSFYMDRPQVTLESIYHLVK